MLESSTSLERITPGETDEPRIIYFPGFGGSDLAGSRHKFLIELSQAAKCEVLQVKRTGSDFDLIGNENAASDLISQLKKILKTIRHRMFFLTDCFAAGVALDLSEEFSDRVQRTIMVSPPIDDFEGCFKRLFEQHPNPKAQAQKDRQWDRLNRMNNRSGFDLTGKCLDQADALYLTGDRIIFPPQDLRGNDRLFDSGSFGHYNWEECPGLLEHIVSIVKNNYPET